MTSVKLWIAWDQDKSYFAKIYTDICAYFEHFQLLCQVTEATVGAKLLTKLQAEVSASCFFLKFGKETFDTQCLTYSIPISISMNKNLCFYDYLLNI